MEVDPRDSAQFVVLYFTISATDDRVSEVDVCAQMQLLGRCGSFHNLILVAAWAGWKEHRDLVMGVVVDQVRKPLSWHALPVVEAAVALGCAANPVERIVLLRVVPIRMLVGGLIFHFVQVVPWAGIENIVEPGKGTLAEDWDQFLRHFE